MLIHYFTISSALWRHGFFKCSPVLTDSAMSTCDSSLEAAHSKDQFRQQPPSYSCLRSRFSHVWLFKTLWTVACLAPLSMGFSRQAYWSGLPFPPPGDPPDPRDPTHLLLPGSLPIAPPGKPMRCFDFPSLCLWPLLRSFKASLSQFSGNSFPSLLLVSFLPFVGILNFIILGPFSQTILRASAQPPSLFCLCVWHDLGSTLSPSPARGDWLRRWCRRAGSQVLRFLANRPGSPLWNCPNKGRRACPVWILEGNWCLPHPLPAPTLAGTDSWTRVHALTSYQEVPGGAWGLAAPALLAELGTHPQLAATCNPSCLLATWAQSPSTRAHPLL